jgi:lipoate---protein ligase
VWIDLWLPRGDPLWHDDVVRAPEWIGEWWAGVLRGAGAVDLAVHRGDSVAGPWSSLICFAGVGPGEVLAGGRKVVGVAQWRSREGALFHSCAYRCWNPLPLVDLLHVPNDDVATGRVAMADVLSPVAVGLEALVGPSFRVESLLDGLPPGPSWDTSTS